MNEGLDFVWRFTLYAIGVMAVMFAVALGVFLIVRKNSLKKDSRPPHPRTGGTSG